MEVRISKKIFVPVYLPYLDNTKRYQIYYGGRGSGKSQFIAQKKLILNMRDVGRNTIVLRKHATTNRYSTFSLFQQLISKYKLEQIFDINISRMEITNKINKNQIRFGGLDNPEKFKGTTFLNGILTDVWIEEATEITKQDFTTVDLTLRGKSNIPFEIDLTFNPISNRSWIKSTFFDITSEDSEIDKNKVSILKTCYKDNPFLDDDYKQRLERLQFLDENAYAVNALGEWGTHKSIIFTNYEVKDLSTDIGDYDAVCMGMDFGFNDPSVAVLVGLKDRDIYILGELYKKQKTTEEWIEDYEKFLNENGWHRGIRIVADSAEQDRIKTFRNKGFLHCYGAEKGQGSVLNGINFLKSRRIYINATCPYTIKEFQSYSWKVDKKTEEIIDEPIDFDNHCIDAIRYATEQWRDSKNNLGFVKLR
jgi:phage terminase large subunit